MKQTKIFTFFFTLLFVTAVFGQQSLNWQKIYPGAFNDDNIGYDLCESTDGYFYLVGITEDFWTGDYNYIIKIDKFGNIIWSRIYPFPMAHNVAPTIEGGCVITGGGGYFLKINGNGDTVTFKHIQDTIQSRRDIDLIRTSDNNFIACGYYVSVAINNARIIKYDSSGNIKWEKRVPNSYRRLNSIIETYDKNYIAVGLHIIKVDTSGNTIWEKFYTGNNSYSIDKIGNYYLILGDGINKIDDNGNRLDSFRFQQSDSIWGQIDMAVLNTNRYLILSIIHFPNSYKLDKLFPKFSLINAEGFVIRQKIFSNNHMWHNSIIKTSDNYLMSIGYSEIDKSNNDYYHAIRTDTMLNVPLLGIFNSESIIPIHFELYQNYTNPFNPTTTIKYDLPIDGIAKITVYDITGKTVFSNFEYKTAGIHSFLFDGINLSSGVYFYKIVAGQFSDVKRMVLLR
jgi:hypothetical protein